jgi:acyl-CoA-dependent ceramide synthase
MATKTALRNGSVAPNTMHADKAAVAPQRRKQSLKKVEDEGLMASLCTLICNHQIGMSLCPCRLPLASTHHVRI